MADKRTATKSAQRSQKRTTSKAASGFTTEERAAMKERVRELKAKGKGDGESDVLQKISEMQKSDREMAERIHAIVKETAPELEPRTWYGMPAYSKDGKVLCYFRNAEKFKTRYATFGFNDNANLDDGAMWPTDFAVKEMTSQVEKQIEALVKKAVS